MTRSASNLFVCSVVLRTLLPCSPVVLAGLELCSCSSCAWDSILVWFVWNFGLDVLLLVCRVCFWIPFCAFVTAAGGSFLSIFIFFTLAGGSFFLGCVIF